MKSWRINMRDERGSIVVIAIIAVLTLSIMAISLTKGTMLGSKNSFLNINKEVSDSYAEHGISLFLERMKLYVLNEESGGFNLDKEFLDGAKKEADLNINFSGDVLDYTSTVDHILKKYDGANNYKSSMYSFNPPIEEIFNKRGNFKVNTPIRDFGQISISGDFNDNFETLEFYMLTHDIDANNIILNSYNPFVDDNKMEEIDTISVENLYNLKFSGNKHTILNAEDNIEIRAVYDKGFSNMVVYILVGKKDIGDVDIFEYQPYKTSNKFKHLVTENYTNLTKVKLVGFYSPSLEATELFILACENNNDIKINAYIPVVASGNFEIVDTFDVNANLGRNLVDFSSYVYWDENMYSTNMYIPVITESLGVERIDLFMYSPYVEGVFKNITGLRITEGMDGEAVLNNFTPNNIDVATYYDVNQIGTAYMILALGNSDENKITYHICYPETEKWNSHNEIILENDEKVGRIDVAAVNADLSEVVLINPTAIYKREKIEVHQATNNVLTSVYGVNSNLISKTHLKLNSIIEYIEPENKGEKILVNKSVEKIIKDTN